MSLKFPRRGSTIKYEKKNRNLGCVMVFLAVENENRQLKAFPQADFGRVNKIFLLSVRKSHN